MRNNGAKLIVKHFNTSVDQHFHPIKITPTWNALPSEVASSRTVNSFKNSLDKHWAENPQTFRVNWQQSNHRCCAHFKGAQTVVGQRFAGNGQKGLSYYCYYNYYYIRRYNNEYVFVRTCIRVLNKPACITVCGWTSVGVLNLINNPTKGFIS